VGWRLVFIPIVFFWDQSKMMDLSTTLDIAKIPIPWLAHTCASHPSFLAAFFLIVGF